jgi:hypothetical protein
MQEKSTEEMKNMTDRRSIMAIVLTVIAMIATWTVAMEAATVQNIETQTIPLNGGIFNLVTPIGSTVTAIAATGDIPSQQVTAFYEPGPGPATEVHYLIVVPKDSGRPKVNGGKVSRLGGCFEFVGLDAWGHPFDGQLCAYRITFNF